MAQQLQLYEREYYFYSAIAPSLNVVVPEFICIVRDDEYDNCGILLENLYYRDTEFALNLDLNEASVDTTLRVLEDCARLHGCFVDKDCESLFPDLKRHNHGLFQPKWELFVKEKWPLFQSKWNTVVLAKHMDIMQWCVNHFRFIQDSLSTGMLTLVHGDVKSPNIFYLPQLESYKPYFIDWQYIAYGKGVQDVVFFLIESFDRQTIREKVFMFRDYYYIKCKEVSEKMRKEYSVEQYRKDFLTSIFYFPFFVAIWFGTLSQEDLIDKNFPFFFIQKLCNFFDLFEDEIIQYMKLISY